MTNDVTTLPKKIPDAATLPAALHEHRRSA